MVPDTWLPIASNPVLLVHSTATENDRTCHLSKNTSCVMPGKKKMLFTPFITSAPKKRPITHPANVNLSG